LANCLSISEIVAVLPSLRSPPPERSKIQYQHISDAISIEERFGGAGKARATFL
jgi:hypothetical protein